MKPINRRDLCLTLPALAATVAGAARSAEAYQVHTSEYPAPAAGQAKPEADKAETGKPTASAALAAARVFAYDQMPVRTMANGAESRDVVHGTLATGERVNLHQSMQAVSAPPNPAHVIQHTEFILVREGELEFQHEIDGQMVSERAGPGSVIYVALGTKHAVRNIGSVPVRYMVVAVGGDVK